MIDSFHCIPLDSDAIQSTSPPSSIPSSVYSIYPFRNSIHLHSSIHLAQDTQRRPNNHSTILSRPPRNLPSEERNLASGPITLVLAVAAGVRARRLAARLVAALGRHGAGEGLLLFVLVKTECVEWEGG